ncbi:hypothetical protein EMQ25_17585 [Arsenicitalea aurantiaca]|uniref:Uncharacterized protein n=1 Tax=Arsenicitalea aurantiaca TaxID=1783274 RepID=A0A433X273_9HYPH|nr:hypothetical protein [Arsenicitalea aurantiaca]RUT28209.1 hypothetical protein EMQ25_17585 [Arsenicitalea aurantiaca]
MSRLNHQGTVLPQNTGLDDDAFPPGIAQPVSQTEIDEFLYSDERPAEERVARLREMREEVAARETADLGTDDPGALLRELDDAIERLEESWASGEPTSFDHDPADHRETLAPDSDELEAIEQEDRD